MTAPAGNAGMDPSDEPFAIVDLATETQLLTFEAKPVADLGVTIVPYYFKIRIDLVMLADRVINRAKYIPGATPE